MSARGELVGWLPSAPTVELAGARLRCFLPLQYLAARGVVGELFDPARTDRYDVCVFQKRYGEEDLRLAAELRASGRRVILDQCDNHLYDPERRPVYQERAERLRRMLALADLVTVPTPELGRALGAPFAVVDDALDPVTPPTLKQRALALLQNARRRKRLLWFGNAGHEYPPFGLVDLARILGDLNQVAGRSAIELLVISNDEAATARATAGASFPVLYRRYETATFQSLARTADLCLLPVTENDFTRGKSVNRPALALRLGLPVVADPLPSYRALCAYLRFAAPGAWSAAILAALADLPSARRQTHAARAAIESSYSPDQIAAQWRQAFARVRNPASLAA